MEHEAEDDLPAEAAFRRSARTFFSGHLAPRPTSDLPQVMGAGSDDLEPVRSFLELLGPWAVPGWPEEAGGLGATPTEVAVVAEELARFEAPDLYPCMVGLSLVGPAVLEHGTPEQQARWLSPIRAGREIWCQLYSEPAAGSDLASLSCRAVADGGTWRVSGQKVWSSRAHYSHRGLLLARTDPHQPRHRGISCFALDMAQPGIVVRPLVQLNGDTHFNEVFLDDVVVADGDRIGPLGGGWKVAMTTLASERSAIGQGGATLEARHVLDLVRASGKAGDPLVRQRAARLVIRLRLAQLNAGRAGAQPPAMGSAAKIWMSDTIKAAGALAMDLAGPAALAVDGDDLALDRWRTLFLTGPSLSIRGGTDEVMRTILGERVLGLPPEPRATGGG
ncbi:MAG: acyl-CoA dehydrogenase family protein [Acidimicrobiales bacterium]